MFLSKGKIVFSIGEFSKLAKTTVRALRFYDEINLFKPSFIEDNGYRYYSIKDLDKLVKIVELRSIGMPIKDIKKILDGSDEKTILLKRSKKIKEEILQNKCYLILLEKLLKDIKKGDCMEKYQPKEIVVPETKVYYRHGIIEDYSKMVGFILEAGEECKKNNPSLKCKNYCFVTYGAKEYQEKNVDITYVEAVEEFGKESENIKFTTMPEIKAISVFHKGSYSNFRETYAFIVGYINKNGYKITAPIREVYIHGCWDCEKEEDYLTEIQVPIE